MVIFFKMAKHVLFKFLVTNSTFFKSPNSILSSNRAIEKNIAAC